MNPTEEIKQKSALPIPNLPEGIEAYDLGVAKEDEFELVGSTIYKGVRPGAASGLLVRPAKGYSFQPAQIADIRNFTLVPGPEGTYMVVKQEEPTVITVTLKVQVTNSFDEGVVSGVLKALEGLPGFVSLERS